MLSKSGIRILFLLLLVAVSFTREASGQYSKDLQFWQKADAEARVTGAYGISLGFESRLTKNASDFSYYFIDLGNYLRIFENLKASFDILYVNKEVHSTEHSERWQYNISTTYRNQAGRFRFYDRLLNEAQYVDYSKTARGKVLQDFYLRDKIIVRYKISGTFYPYVEDEIYYRLDHQSYRNPSGFNRNRIYTGLLIYIDKADRIDLFYLFEHNFNVIPLTDNYVVGVGFSRSLF
jgi:hypothetical protein